MRYETILENAMQLETEEKQQLAKEMMRMIIRESGTMNSINVPELAYLEVQGMDIDYKQEHFIVIALNGFNEVIGKIVATKGLLNSSQVHPRETFKWAIRNNAASVIIAHNHPSENVEPSPADISITQKLVESGVILGIPVIDHVIFTEDNFCSMVLSGEM